MSFADRLKEARRVCGLSQEELAEHLDVSRQAVGKWEQGQTYPEVEKLLTLCAVLNTSLDALMADELPVGCRSAANSPAPSESILIRGIHLVRCTSVMRSQLFRSRRGKRLFCTTTADCDSEKSPASRTQATPQDQTGPDQAIKSTDFSQYLC